MKKICSIIILAAILIFSTNFADAQDVYVGTYPESNLNAYLMTETVKIIGRNPFGLMFNCTVRAGKNYYINYNFTIEGTTARNRRTRWQNSDGYSGYLGENSPVETAINRYVMNNWY